MRNLLAIILLIIPTLLSAQSLTPEQALKRAQSATAIRKAPSASARFSLISTATAKGEPAVYLFRQTGGGFLLLSADERAEAVLGYADDGTYDEQSIPAPLAWWMEEYAREIGTLRTHQPVARKAASETLPAIPILCPTVWDQSASFEYELPMGHYSSGKAAKCAVGCVAMATMQVMRAHNWPVSGEGSHSYLWHYDGVDNELTFDYANTTFEWDKMLNSYIDPNTGKDIYYTTYTYSDAAKAVSHLAYGVGVALNMNYDPSGSASEERDVPAALVEHFRYDPSIHYIERKYFTTADWETLVYGQLAAGQPMIYCGGIHAMVCDGYTDGLFHINWGWGGRGNGYMRLSALSNKTQGTGYDASGYNTRQRIVYNIKPKTGAGDPVTEMVTSERFGVSASTGSLTVSGSFYNRANAAASGALGLSVEPWDGNQWATPYYIEGTSFTAVGRASAITSGYTCALPATMGDGSYRLMPAHRTSRGDWQRVRVLSNENQYCLLTINGSSLTITNAPGANLEATLTLLPKAIYQGGTQSTVCFKVTNLSGDLDFEGNLRGYIVDGDGDSPKFEALATGWTQAILPGGETLKVTYKQAYSPFMGGSGTGEKYFRLAVCNSYGEWVRWASAAYPVWYGVAGGAGDPGAGAQFDYTAEEDAPAMPSFSLASGTYEGAQMVTISSVTDGCTIHYTTDGSTPTAKSSLYDDSKGVVIAETTTLRAVAAKNGLVSPVALATYTILQPEPPSPGELTPTAFNPDDLTICYHIRNRATGNYLSFNGTNATLSKLDTDDDRQVWLFVESGTPGKYALVSKTDATKRVCFQYSSWGTVYVDVIASPGTAYTQAYALTEAGDVGGPLYHLDAGGSKMALAADYADVITATADKADATTQWYLETPQDPETAINSVLITTTSVASPAYDLSGRRLAHPAAITIISGKKINIH